MLNSNLVLDYYNLLCRRSDLNPGEKEIFMYDIATQSVSKLSGELSSAFVEAAETNSDQSLTKDKSKESNIQRISGSKKAQAKL